MIFQTGQFLTLITGVVPDLSGTNLDVRANDRPGYGNLPDSQRLFSAKLQKKFYIREQMYFQLEGSATNLLNHANFGIPAQNLSSASFGRITTTQQAEGAGARSIQVGLRFNF